jgi:3-oxoadipate enol-lactonase
MHVIEEGAGRALVFIHAFPLNGRMWAPQSEALRSRFRILRPDLPGFGMTAPPMTPPTVDDYARLCLALLDARGIDRCVLTGCSLGGYVAMAAMRLFPERLRGVVLANTRGGADSQAQRDQRGVQASLARDAGVEVAVGGMVTKLLSPGAQRTQHERVESVNAMVREATVGGVAGALHAMAARPASYEAIRRYPGRVCVISGAEDELTPPSEGAAIAEVARDPEFHTLAGAGHLSNLERPDLFTEILVQFIDTLP